MDLGLEPAEKDRDTEDTLFAHTVLPGFIDIHTHGLGGHHDLVYSWTNPAFSLSRLPAKGTTSVLASLIFTKDLSQTATVVAAVKAATGRTDLGAVIEGIHAGGSRNWNILIVWFLS